MTADNPWRCAMEDPPTARHTVEYRSASGRLLLAKRFGCDKAMYDVVGSAGALFFPARPGDMWRKPPRLEK